MPDRLRVMPFVLAAGVSAALVLAARQFVAIIGGIVVAAVLAAVVAAVVRIRDRRGLRYGGLALSILMAAAYVFVTRTDDPQVNAVQSFHFVEYGLVTLLFYRAWRPAGDASALVLPVVAGLVVGTVEEWFQWFIPVRVGEVRDVFLNGVAIGCGLMFSVSLDPPSRSQLAFTGQALGRIGVAAAVFVLVFGAFFQNAHMGHEITEQGPGSGTWTFRSGYSGDELARLSAARGAEWRGGFVGRPRRLSREDQYMTEGHWHVARRNEAWAEGDVAAAWNENLILERYFAPVLDTPSYLSATGHRWSSEHLADAGRRFGELAPAHYESQAHPAAIHVWPLELYWLAISAIALLLGAPWVRARVSRARGDRVSATVGS
jgi:VanZ family protein